MKNLYAVADSLGVKTAVDELNAAADLIEQRGATAIIYEQINGSYCTLGALWQASDDDVATGGWFDRVDHHNGVQTLRECAARLANGEITLDTATKKD